MSETNTITIPKRTREKLKLVSEQFSTLNTGSVGDELWIASDDGNSGYDWTQTDMGVNKNGELVFCEQGGCSCNGPEQPTPDKTFNLDEKITFEENYDITVKPTVDELVEVTDTLYKIFNNDDVTPQEIIGLPNAEIRRAVVELVGYEKIVEQAETLDDSDADGRLLRIKLGDDEDMFLLQVQDPSTGRGYFLRVPPEIETAKEARAWTFGFDAEDFNLIKET